MQVVQDQMIQPKDLNQSNLILNGSSVETVMDVLCDVITTDKSRSLMYQDINGIEFDFMLLRQLDFKFPHIDKKRKQIGYLHIRANHYYVFDDGVIYLKIKASFQTDADLQNKQLTGELVLKTEIKYLHQMQNHIFHLYNKHLNISKVR